MGNHTGIALRRGAAAVLLAAAAALSGCGTEDSGSSCKGCRINGDFYDPCPSYPPAYCTYGQPCTIVTDVCK